MTNDTNTRTKANAVFFAAIMVLSMVAVGFAAAPAAAQVNQSDADRTYDNASELDGKLFWQGQSVAVGGFDDNENVALREDQGDGDSQLVEQLNADGEGVIEFDTDDLDEGDYFLASNPDAVFEVAVQNLDTEFEEDSVQSDDTAELEIDSNRGTYALNVSADGDLDDEQLRDLFDGDFTVNATSVDDDDDEIMLEGVNDGTYDVNFSNVDDIATGEYEFAFDVTDTEAEDTASINVTEAGEGGLSLVDGSTTLAQGDVANITVELDETDTGTVVVGNYEDDNYQANISVTDDDDDGEVTVLFNTYTAGRNGDIVEVAGDDDEAELVSQRGDLTDLLDTGDYDVSVSPTGLDGGSAEDALDDETDIGTLVIEERETGDMVLWRTTDDVVDDVAEALDDDGDDAAVEAINASVESGVVTQTDMVAVGDTSDVLVHQISVTGLEGALSAQGANSNAEALYRVLNSSDVYDTEEVHALSLTFTEVNPGSNQEANVIAATDLSESEFEQATTVVYDDETGDYYVFLDIATLNSVLEETEDIDAPEDGDEYTAELTVQEPLLTDAEADDDFEVIEDAYESANATFNVVEADGSFAMDPVEVANADSQNITGTMNIAPGTEISLRVRSDDAETNFIKNAEEIAIQSDGTFSGTFDFSEESVNDTFTVTTRNTPLDEELEAEGMVVESDNGTAGAFTVSDLSPAEATATAGDSVTVSATIENTGDSEATQTVVLTLDGEEIDSQEVTLGAGNSTTVEFTADTSGLEAGDYEHGIATDDDEQTGTLTIETSGDGGDDGGDGTDGSDGGDDGGDGSDGSDGGDGDDGGDGGTDDSTPGFGALVALVALIAAALLATRRSE